MDVIYQSEPHSSQAISKGYGVEIGKPYHTVLGEPVRTLIMTERMYAKRDVAARFMKCFVEATRHFIRYPRAAERYVREMMFNGELSSEDYKMATANSPFTYNVTVQHIQTTTDLMVKYGIGRMSRPPVAREYVKLDLLDQAKKALRAN